MEFLIADLTKIILNFLPLTDIVRFRSINKKWKQIIDSVYDSGNLNIFTGDCCDIEISSPDIEYYFDTYLIEEYQEGWDLDKVTKKYETEIIPNLEKLIQEFNNQKSLLNNIFGYNPFIKTNGVMTPRIEFHFGNHYFCLRQHYISTSMMIRINGHEIQILYSFVYIVSRLRIYLQELTIRNSI